MGFTSQRAYFTADCTLGCPCEGLCGFAFTLMARSSQTEVMQPHTFPLLSGFLNAHRCLPSSHLKCTTASSAILLCSCYWKRGSKLPTGSSNRASSQHTVQGQAPCHAHVRRLADGNNACISVFCFEGISCLLKQFCFVLTLPEFSRKPNAFTSVYMSLLEAHMLQDAGTSAWAKINRFFRGSLAFLWTGGAVIAS